MPKPSPAIYILIAAVLLALPLNVAVAGKPQTATRVVDGDTLAIAGDKYRLSGIDAPESKQTCGDTRAPWACGTAAAEALRGKVKGGQVQCRREDRDRYGRFVATCYLADGTDLNAWMVAQGWAMAYRQYAKTYVGTEAGARAAHRGIWASEVTPPWVWRAAKRKVARAIKSAPS